MDCAAVVVTIVFVSLASHLALAEPLLGPSSYLEPQVTAPSYSINGVWLAHQHLPNFAEVEEAAKDTFVYLPSKYLDDYRNPCWEEEGHFRCLPYFQILGVSKCGTTDLYHRLMEHPDVARNGWKGPHFWDEAPYVARTPDPYHYDGSFPAYVRVFDKPAADIKSNRNAITGEASSNTFTAVYSHLRGLTLDKRTNATLAEYMWEAMPFARYIVMFRDPVTRYRSAYFYYRNTKQPPPTDTDFLLSVKEDIRSWNSCLRHYHQLHCLKLYHPEQLIKGMYAEFLPGWLAVWPRDRFLFLRTEDYKEAPTEHVQAAMKFLGLRELPPETMFRIARLEAQNTQSKTYNASARSPQLTEAYNLLRDFYRPYNERLSKMFGDDPRWLWGY